MISTEYIGMDVHKESISIAVRNAAGDHMSDNPCRLRRSMQHAAAPFFVLSLDILGDEVNARVSAHELRHRIRHSLRECDVCGAVRGSDFDPADARDMLIHNQTEAELVQLEAQASLLIANEDHDEVERDVARLSKRRERRSIPKGN
jgi:hypothetical protein